MRVLLRVAALWQALVCLALLSAVGQFLLTRSLQETTGRGWIEVLVLVVLPPLAAFGAIQLWRLRESGRRAGVVVVVTVLVIAATQGVELTAGSAVRWAIAIALLAALLSRQAQAACAGSLKSEVP
jgi:hypothetical protein